MTRKEAQAILNGLGVTNKFTLRTIGFSDLARCDAQFVTVKNWRPDTKANEIKAAFRPLGVFVQFE